MSDMNREKVLERITKLLKLSKGTSSVEESATAAAQAQQLMLKYKIEQAALDEHTADPEPVESPQPLFASKRMPSWKRSLSQVIATTNQVYTYRHGPAVMMVGAEDDINTVRYMFSYLVKEVERLARTHCKGCDRTYGNNFRWGVVQALKVKFAEQRAEAARNADETTTRALVRIDKQLARAEDFAQKLHPDLRTTRYGRAAGDDGARNAGFRAGRSINLNRGGAGGLAAGRRQLGSGS